MSASALTHIDQNAGPSAALRSLPASTTLLHVTQHAFDSFDPTMNDGLGIHLASSGTNMSKLKHLLELEGPADLLRCATTRDLTLLRVSDFRNWAPIALIFELSLRGILPKGLSKTFNARLLDDLFARHSDDAHDILSFCGAPVIASELGRLEDLQVTWEDRGVADRAARGDRSALMRMLRELQSVCPVLAAQLELFFIGLPLRLEARSALVDGLDALGIRGAWYHNCYEGGESVMLFHAEDIEIRSRASLDGVGRDQPEDLTLQEVLVGT